MKKKITAAYMHKLLKDELFSDVDLTRIPKMSAEERRVFNLQQLDRIIGMRSHADALGWFVGQFIQYEGERREDNPLYEEEGTPLVDWYLELVWLGYELYNHIPFDLDLLVPGLAQDKTDPEYDFTIDNVALTDWLTTTPYRFVAMLVGRTMLEVEYSKVIGYNDAEQDYYAEHCPSGEFHTADPEEATQAVQMLLDGLREIRSHREQGRQLGLSAEQERVVDLLWSWVPHDYPEEYVAAAREMVEAAECEMPGKTVIRSRQGFLDYKKQLMPKLVAIVRKYDLPVDLTDRYNLTTGYMNAWLYSKYLGRIVLDE